MPLGEIARRCEHWGAELFVDAIQSLGSSPLDLEGIHYLAAGGHKWLMGPEGIGIIYAREDKAQNLIPRLAGWLSHREPTGFLFDGPGQLRYDRPIRSSISFLESGTQNPVGALVKMSVHLLNQLGFPYFRAHSKYCSS